MKIIGLCGGSGSGKGVVCRVFHAMGIGYIDTDAVYRELTSAPCDLLRALEDEFGREIITERGSLNREVMRTVVFSGEGSEHRLARLNEITHKYILDETRRRLSAFADEGLPAAIVDAPALFESGFDSECDLIICVVADYSTRIQRIMARDGITRRAAEERIAAQIPDGELIERCDHVIYNDGDISDLERQVSAILLKILDNN